MAKDQYTILNCNIDRMLIYILKKTIFIQIITLDSNSDRIRFCIGKRLLEINGLHLIAVKIELYDAF